MTSNHATVRTGPHRRLPVTGSVVLGLLQVAACSSGLEGLDPKGTTDISGFSESTNLRFGFDPCVALTAPITDLEVAGGVLPTLTGSRERPFALVAFTTATAIGDEDDAIADGNDQPDVYLAVVDANRIDRRAFTYGIYGAMRTTRCVTCHQMNVPVTGDPVTDPTPFLTQPHFGNGEGIPPLNDLGPEKCENCHFHDWLAPGPTFDLRFDGTSDLFARAQTPPRGLDVHFSTDPRVLWALGVAQTPFGGAADDDHDGVDEPEDTDGVRRHTPGGIPRFLRRLKDWQDTEDPVTGEPKFSSAEDAVQDLALVSRNFVAVASGGVDGSKSPSLIYVPNGAYDPSNPTAFAAGTVFLAFQSDASNLVGGASNTSSDVFRVAVTVRVLGDGTLDLVYQPFSQVHVSQAFGGGDAGGASGDPKIAAGGNRIAFVSEAQDLINGGTPNCRNEVYLWDSGAGTFLVSHRFGLDTTPGNAGAVNPAISSDGAAVCFESDASNLVPADANGTRDVFYALWPLLEPVRASVDEAGNEFAGHSTGGSIFHRGGEVRVAFANQEGALPAVTAGLCATTTPIPAADAHTVWFDTGAGKYPDGSGSFNTNAPLYVGRNNIDTAAGKNEARTLVRFDLTGLAGATILEAELRMQQTKQGSGVSNSLQLFRQTTGWNGISQANSSFSVTNGSVGGTARASVPTSTNGEKIWASAAMANDVRDWSNSPAMNFGWVIAGTSAAGQSVKTFDDIGQANPPTLVVRYIPAAPLTAARTPGSGTSCVYVRDTASAQTINLNRIVGPDGTEVAEETAPDGTPLGADSARPVISPNGDAVLFETMAMNLDSARNTGLNRVKDVVLADLTMFDTHGYVLPYVISVTADGDEANGPSHSPRFGVFDPPTDAFPLGLAVYETDATNLGNTDPGDIDGDGVAEHDNFMFKFLSEGGAVLADFEARPARQGQNRGVAFQNHASGDPSTFLWDFGDGTTSTWESPVHVYTTPGLYTVTLTATGDLGTDSRTRADYVQVLDNAVADFVSTKDSSMSGAPTQQAFVFQPDEFPVFGAIDTNSPGAKLSFALSSADSLNFPETFRWFLTPVDDLGTPLGASLLVASEPDPTIDVSVPGLYDLTLEAEGPGGVGRTSQRLQLYRKVDAAFVSMPAGVPIRGDAPLQVQFTDTSTGDLEDAFSPYTWDFGDGTSSPATNPLHNFTEGIYFVELTVLGKGRDSSAVRVPVIADGAITAAFTVAPQLAGSVSGVLLGETVDDGPPALVDFVNLSQNAAGAAETYTWNFGVGATGKENDRDPVGIPFDLANADHAQGFSVSLATSTAAPPQNRVVFGAVLVYPRPAPLVHVPGPSFKVDPLRPPSLVNLSGEVLGDGAGTTPVYRWFRNDADGAPPSIPIGNGTLAFTHDFDGSGTFQVALECETNAPGGARQVVRSAPQDVVVTASTFREWYEQAVDKPSGAKCTNCHKGADAPAGLEWFSTQPDVASRAAEVHGRIVNVRSQACDTSRMRILPGDPENSVVWAVLQRDNPLCSAINMRVNLPGDDAAREAHVATLRSWILSGAPNN